jgi:hypothetical protein
MLNFSRFWQRKPTVLIFIDLMQDLDVILPLIKAINADENFFLKICVSRQLIEESPRVKKALDALRTPYSIIRYRFLKLGLQPNLRNVDALITASETSAKPHRYIHLLTKRANQRKIFTYTLQHGWENIGLTYFDNIHSPDTIHFASQKIFIWGNIDSLVPEVLPETKSRCVAVGCPKEKEVISTAAKLEIPNQRDYVISVFENLHWHRYSDYYRERFLQDLETTATQLPDTTFLVKPHHAGQWLTKRYKGRLPTADNLVIINPIEPQWEPFTAPALIARSDGIITTPSTVALDAARLELPVSVIGYDLDLPKYEPLPIIYSLVDWLDFIKQIRHPEGRQNACQKTSTFFKKSILPGNAIERILELIKFDITNRKDGYKNAD